MATMLPPLIQAMLNPAFYDHEAADSIELIQTHISYVFLTGDFAYKIKKPVDFGFLDFTTLDLRQQYCETELRLNRRLSPDLYLEVVSIGQQGESYRLRQQPAVEYAVKMRQFPQSCLFSQLFKNRELQPGDLIDLAKQVAVFHQEATTSAEIQAYGEVDIVRSIHENNYQISEPFLGLTQTTQQYQDTKAFTLSFFHAHEDWLLNRLSHIKECHGDLHLNNVCRYGGNVQVFDCIEFNQEFRNIDTLYDVAFMVMDLEFQGRSDLAYRFLNTYIEATGDYLGVRLLPLYLLMRAYIRGNVSSLALNDSAIAPDQRESLKQKAIAYYKLAWSYTQRSQGCLYLMSGVSGSGKSTVAQALTRLTPAIHIRSDAVRKHLAGIPLSQNGSQQGIYTDEMTQKTYDRLLELGLALAQAGWSVILDAKYDRQIHRQKAIESCGQQNFELKILHCTADIHLIRERLQHRQGDISDATSDLLTQQLASSEKFSEAEKKYVYTLKTDMAILPQLQSLLPETGSSKIL